MAENHKQHDFNLTDAVRKQADDNTRLLPQIERTKSTDNNIVGISAQGNLVLEACKKAADMIRNVHTTHQAEGETLAQHIEHVGETILSLCQEAAANVRAVRIMPKELSEDTAKDLMRLGEDEHQRFLAVTNGIIAARKALTNIIDSVPPKKEDE